MTPRIILLNGPAGVGKTTVGRALAATAANGVCIHGDDLKHFIVTQQPGQVAAGLAYQNAASVARNFAGGGYELIVVEFVFEHPRHVARFCTALATDSIPIHLFTLWAPLELVLQRER
ncbi:MAG TPA: AAA family ATPase, partial [Caldilineaceae bacterium]|nr:AAA family ATPase [Caldilineaceae bacterium]